MHAYAVARSVSLAALARISLRDTGISAKGGVAIAEALKFHSSLMILDLCFNRIGTKGSKAIAEALRVNHSLTSLYIGSNEIGPEGGEAVAEALRLQGSNCSLTSLDLKYNDFDEDSRSKLRGAVHGRSSFNLVL